MSSRENWQNIPPLIYVKNIYCWNSFNQNHHKTIVIGYVLMNGGNVIELTKPLPYLSKHSTSGIFSNYNLPKISIFFVVNRVHGSSERGSSFYQTYDFLDVEISCIRSFWLTRWMLTLYKWVLLNLSISLEEIDLHQLSLFVEQPDSPISLE